MKTLFVLFVSFVLIGVMGEPGRRSGQPDTPLNQYRSASLRFDIPEVLADWKKQLARHVSYGREALRVNSLDEIRYVNNLRVHQASAWAHPDSQRKHLAGHDTLRTEFPVATRP